MKTYFFFILLSVLSLNCSKDSNPSPINPPTPTLPVVTTNSMVTIFNITSASSGGTVLIDGGASITARGICWATNSNPTIAGNVYNSGLGTGTGTFSGSMHNLTPGATYFVKAFATNSAGTAYGAAVMFTVTSGTPPGGDFFAAGNLNYGGNSTPTLWKNGIPSALTAGINPAQAYSVFAVGPDNYVTGYERNGSTDMARIWTNGAGIFLTNANSGGGAGHSVYVSGSNVYVAGESTGPSNTMATIWRNSVATLLSAGTSPAGAYSVCVSGGTNVCVAGYEGNVAKIWRNGVATSLTNGANTAVAYGVTIFFPDEYIVGYEMIGTKSAAKIWRNGVATFLTNGSSDAVAYSVYINYNLGTGTDEYVAGYEYNGTKNVAKVWKNGVAISLTDGTKNAVAKSVHGSGTDIYVGGYENDGTKNVAKVWKNGLEISLQNSATAGLIGGVFAK